MSASALDTWAHILTSKKKAAEANKIMKLSFFFNYDSTWECNKMLFIFTSIKILLSSNSSGNYKSKFLEITSFSLGGRNIIF